MAKSKPVHTIRLGRVKAAIWANKTDMGLRHNVTVQRLYKQDDEWLTTDSFGRDDLMLVCKVMSMAHTWIYEANQQSDGPAKEAAAGKPDDEAGEAAEAGEPGDGPDIPV